MTRQVEHVKGRRAKGLCGYAGCSEVSGDRFRCPTHAKEHAARMKAIYWEKREAAERAKAA